MGTADRSKRRDVLWKKAILHFSLCFVMGFFTGFAPATTGDSTKKSQFSSVKHGITAAPEKSINSNRSLMVQENGTAVQPKATVSADEKPTGTDSSQHDDKLLILVTTTRSSHPFKPASLQRLAHTLKLVPAPLLWIVVEARAKAQQTAAMLRMTGVMYRHLVVNENFTDAAAEIDYQRNNALNHIRHHRLVGVVHFADLSNVYDLQFFDEIRHIESFGAWPVASVSTNRKRVTVEGPVCRSSAVLGWHMKKEEPEHNTTVDTSPGRQSISYFAFNSSTLWDSSPSDVANASQDAAKFVQKAVMEDESKLMAFPPDCSSVMVWHLHIHRSLFLGYSASIQTLAADKEANHTQGEKH